MKTTDVFVDLAFSRPAIGAGLTSGPRLRPGLALLLSVSVSIALGDEEAGTSRAIDVLDGLNPYVVAGITFESNLLLSPSSPQSDYYGTLGAGFDRELRFGQQQIDIDAYVYRNTYDRFQYLNHYGGEANVVWSWRAGRLWSGQIGYGFDQSLRSFAFQTIPVKDLIARNRVFAEADRWLSDRWKVGVNGALTDVAFSESGNQDRTLAGGGLVLDYVTEESNSVGIRGSFLSGDFQSDGIEDFVEFQVGPRGLWRPTEKTRVQAFAGYLERDYDEGGDQDFNGPVGNLSVFWRATGKISVDLFVWRTVSALGDEIANYAVVQGATVQPIWELTSKTAFRALIGYQEQDFRGDDLDPLGLGPRLDKVTDLELWVDWNPRDHIRISIGSTLEDRDSSRPLKSYDNQIILGQLQFAF